MQVGLPWRPATVCQPVPPPLLVIIVVVVLVTQSGLTLYHPMYSCSSPGSSVHDILQARILQWIAFSRGLSHHSQCHLLKLQRNKVAETQ